MKRGDNSHEKIDKQFYISYVVSDKSLASYEPLSIFDAKFENRLSLCCFVPHFCCWSKAFWNLSSLVKYRGHHHQHLPPCHLWEVG